MTVPDTDHVARHVPPGKQDGDEASMDAFTLRLDADEDFLSVDWLEKSGQTALVDQLKHVVIQLAGRRRTVKPSDRLARLNVGNSKAVVDSMCEVAIDFLYLGKGGTDTYSGIYGIPLDPHSNEKVALQLAILSKGELHPPP